MIAATQSPSQQSAIGLIYVGNPTDTTTTTTQTKIENHSQEIHHVQKRTGWLGLPDVWFCGLSMGIK
jgi:hypothetical protein